MTQLIFPTFYYNIIYLGIIFQFSQTNFIISEGIAEVCIDLTSGVLSTNTPITIAPQIGSAGGIKIETSFK
jgi:hypothetical protein